MKNLKNIPTWNLSDFYSSISDKKISADLKKIEKDTKKFVSDFAGKINKISAPKLFEAIQNYEKISENIGKISSYSYLIYAADLSNQKNISFYQNISEALSGIESQLIFFTIELNEVDEKKLKNPALKKYQPFIRDSRIFKKHQLSNELEKFSLEKNGTLKLLRLIDCTA